VIALNGLSQDAVLGMAASAERYSEHPLAEAVRAAAVARGITVSEPRAFVAEPGVGVRAVVEGAAVSVGRITAVPAKGAAVEVDKVDATQRISILVPAAALEAQGKTVLHVMQDGMSVGLIATSDTLRPEVPQALAAVRALGIRRIELLTGDNERSASALADPLGIAWRANLLPEQKIEAVKAYQAQGHVVVMVGDGVNDAPALAQADVGIAMGAAGSGVALEAAHVALMREDWLLVPAVLRIARRTMRVVKMNIAFTALYNAAGLLLAAFGLLPPIFAAAAQSLPDIGILANSSRLIGQRQ
jgi:Cd2+/Zn2+-exporting ATPase/Cu+-exporting ATPase